MKLETHAKITWCPGCTNFGILAAVKKAVKELVDEGFAKLQDFVVVSGIGCHAKIYDYLNLNGFYSIHGRVPPTATGIKLANPRLKVLGFAGDGDAYAEGISHLIHAARHNPDFTLIVHNNQVFALTTGQMTPTTEKGYKGKSTPKGAPFPPINPIKLMLASGASFVAREYALDIKNLAETIKAAVKHRGFSFVEVLQPCITFHDTRDFIVKHSYRLKKPLSLKGAMKKAEEWDYSLNPKAKIPLGIFYIEKKPVMEDVLNTKFWAEVYPERAVKPVEVLKDLGFDFA